MVLFRNGVRQALASAGYHASFVCRPPFAERHGQRLAPAPVAGDRGSGANVMRRDAPARRRAPQATRGSRCRRSASNTWPACWRTRAAWPRCARRRSTALAATAPHALAPQAVRVGPRQPRRDAARAGRLRRRRHAHREPHRRAERPIPTSTSPRRSTPGSTASIAAWRPAPPTRPTRRHAAAHVLARRSMRWRRPRAGAAFGAAVDCFTRVKRTELARRAGRRQGRWQRREYFSRF